MDLTRVHQANLAILKEIDRICREEGIQYMLDAGTLIGAVRHKGFIPWDDDADVAFTRDNYTKFIRAAKKKLPAGMTLLEPERFTERNRILRFYCPYLLRQQQYPRGQWGNAVL